MLFLLGIIVELVALYLLSRFISNAFYNLFLRLFHSQTVSIHILAFLFLPGVIVHELAHAIVAKLLFVYVGKMEFFPKMMGETVKLGSVEIGKTDPIRRALIGLAPVLIGVSFFLGVALLLPIASSLMTLNVSYFTSFYFILFLFFGFEVSNTMFSSRRDLEGFLELVLVIVGILAVFYGIVWFTGVTLPSITIPLPTVIFSTLQQLALVLGIVILLNSLIAAILRSFLR